MAKSINDFDGVFDFPVDNYNTNLERGFSSLDQRHQLTGNFNFLVLKKIKVTPILRLGSPLPYTITTGRDNNDDTVFNDRPIGVPRNSQRGTWFKQVDLRLGWSIPLASGKSEDSTTLSILKKYSLGVDITINNVLNQTNLRNFVGNQLSAIYGRATIATPARQIQVGLNFFF